MKRNLFIVANPASGTKKLENILRELVDFAASKKYDFDVYLTAKSQNAWKMVEKNFTEDYTDLVILGGDGTINEAINGLKLDRPVSIIPTGTGNDFVKMLNIGQTLEEQIQTIGHGEIIEVDLGVCNGRKFVNGVGIGFDGQIVEELTNSSSWFTGPVKYYLQVLKTLGSYKARFFGMQLNGEHFEKELILLCVGNGSTFGGGFKLTPQANLQDGLLDVCEIGKLSVFKRFANLYRLNKGTHGQLKEVAFFQSDSFKITEHSNLNAHIDGEPFGSPPFKFTVLPKALKIRVQASAKS